MCMLIFSGIFPPVLWGCGPQSKEFQHKYIKLNWELRKLTNRVIVFNVQNTIVGNKSRWLIY